MRRNPMEDMLRISSIMLDSPSARGALFFISSEVNSIRLQFSRIKAHNKVIDREREIMRGRMSSRTNSIRRMRALFADVRYLLVSLGMLQSLFVMLERALPNELEILALREKYKTSLKDYTDFRDHVEHIYERAQRTSDLGNLSGDATVYTFGGKGFDIGKAREIEVESLYDDIVAALEAIARHTHPELYSTR